MGDDSHSNRRRHRRVRAEVPVRVSTIDPERDRWTGRAFFRATREASVNVSSGQQVSAGNSIGSVGCTGSCTGPHLHFETRVGGVAYDPRGYLS